MIISMGEESRMKKKKTYVYAPEIGNNPFIEAATDLGFEVSLKKGESISGSGKDAEMGGPLVVSLAKNIDRVILRKERKGHGGKIATTVEIRSGGYLNLKEIAKGMKNRLGCGGKVENGLIVLQGDISDRVSEYFRKMGIEKITF